MPRQNMGGDEEREREDGMGFEEVEEEELRR